MSACRLALAFGAAAILAAAPSRVRAGGKADRDASRPAARTPDEAIVRARQLGLAADPLWIALLHYQPGPGGGLESQADGGLFFMAGTGKTDPGAELEADLRAFFLPALAFDDEKEQHPRCRFPARLRFLRERLELDLAAVPAPECRRLRNFREALDAGSATLIFASAFLNSPASAYGHTLLRLDRKGAPPGSDLLSYIVNYSAVPWTENAFLYVVLGVSGGFEGRFSVSPYYMKIQEYSNLEHRDLWEYRLDLGQDAIDRIVDHAWELGSTYFDYFFFTENCSYHMLSLLEVGNPTLRLTGAFHGTVIPVDTVRVVERAGLVRSRVFRPSLARRLGARRELVRGAELELAGELARGDEPARFDRLGSLAKDRQALVLDAAYDYLTYLHGFAVRDPQRLEPEPGEAERLAREQDLLRRRGRLALPAVSPTIAAPPAPEEGHASSMAAFGLGLRDDGRTFLEVGARAALHDLLAPQAGHVPDTQLEMASLRLRFDPPAAMSGRGSGMWLDRLDAVRLMSLAPIAGWVAKPSWRVGFGVAAPHDLACESWSCLEVELDGGPGVALAIGSRSVAYAFGDLRIATGPGLSPAYRIGAGPSIGVVAEPLPRWRLHGQAAYRRNFLGDDRAGPRNVLLRASQAVHVGDELEVRLQGELDNGNGAVSLGFVGYF